MKWALLAGAGAVGWYWFAHRHPVGTSITAPHSVPNAGGVEYISVHKAGALTPTLGPTPVYQPPGP